MRRFRDVVVCAALLALPIAFLRANLRGPERDSATGSLDRAILTLSAPIQRAVVAAAEGARRLWRGYVFLVGLRRENDRLRRDNERLRAQNRAALRAAARVRRYEDLLGLRARTPSQTLAARVIARETSPLFRVVRVSLDRGRSQVRPGLPVVTPEGVVGRIHRAYGRYSDVLLAIDPESRIDARVLPSGARGIARGAGGEGYACRLEKVVREEPVRVGDHVVTTGEGGLFPPDLDVGRVASVSRDEPGLFQEVEVRPAVDFSRVEEVLILLAPPPATDERSPHPGPD